MNASFDPLRLVNSYGAFGAVDEERHEFIVSASSDIEGPWKEYEFKVKPGDVYRRPKFISPYHYRLDWQFWIASSMQYLDRSPWIYTFLLKVLEGDPLVLGRHEEVMCYKVCIILFLTKPFSVHFLALLEKDPFGGETEAPKYIRIDKYRYKFHRPTPSIRKLNRRQRYWKREFIGRVFPREGVVSKQTLVEYVDKYLK